MPKYRDSYVIMSFVLLALFAWNSWSQDNVAPLPDSSTSQEIVDSLDPSAVSSQGTPSKPYATTKVLVDSLENRIDTSKLLPDTPVIQQSAPILEQCIEITKSPAKVLLVRAPESPLLGLVYKGQTYPVVAMGEVWCQIKFRDTLGWIEKTSVKPYIKTRKDTILKDLPLYALATIALIIVIVFLIFGIIALFRRVFSQKTAKVSLPVGKTCLVITNSQTMVSTAFSESTIPIQQCFSEIGFSVTTAPNIADAKMLFMQYVPNVLCVDWRFDPHPVALVENLLLGKSSMPVIVFYNVGDPLAASRQCAITTAHFMGVSLNDRDIFKYVTPVILHSKAFQSVSAGTEIHALEGEVSPGSLMELLQFLEIGNKTGCLLIENNGPFGMMYLKGGQLIYATAQNESSTIAVYSMLNLPNGRFRFILDKIPPAVNISKSTLELLMGWTQASDEAAQH